MTVPGRRRIYLMRHGHVDYFDPSLKDSREAVLTEDGRRQAQACRDALRRIEFDLALCSGLPRARETAEIVLAANVSAPPVEDEPGIEELKSGWLQATSREELAARLAFSFDDAASEGARFLPDGETFVGAQSRIVAAIEQDLCCVNVIDVDVTPAPGGGIKIERAILKAVNLTPYDFAKAGLSRTSLEHLFDVDFGGMRPRQGRPG